MIRLQFLTIAKNRALIFWNFPTEVFLAIANVHTFESYKDLIIIIQQMLGLS